MSVEEPERTHGKGRGRGLNIQAVKVEVGDAGVKGLSRNGGGGAGG